MTETNIKLWHRSLTRADLKAMGFDDPFPEDTMSKLIPSIKWGIIPFNVYTYSEKYPDSVWYVYGGGDYYDELKEELKSEREKYTTSYIDYNNEEIIHTPGYAPVYTKEEVEDICFKLTGKSIYDIDINPSEKDLQDRKRSKIFWDDLQNFKTKNKQELVKIKDPYKKSFLYKIFNFFNEY